MVTQKAISARIDKKLLQELDLEVAIGTGNRNKLINCALAMFLDFMDTRRRCSIRPDFDERATELEQFIVRCVSSTNHLNG